MSEYIVCVLKQHMFDATSEQFKKDCIISFGDNKDGVLDLLKRVQVSLENEETNIKNIVI